MAFQPVDLQSYPRREHYEHFLKLRLTYSAVVQIDITTLRATAKRTGNRIYPTQIWMLTTATNRVPEFRMSRDEQVRLGVWETLVPFYTVLNEQSRTFSSLWTPYSTHFPAFHAQCIATIDQFATRAFVPQAEVPANMLNVSSIPWVEFTGFNLNLPTDFLLPILTIGKHLERDGRTWMPLAVQVHHAVCDGWHLGVFVEQVQSIADDAEAWLVGAGPG